MARKAPTKMTSKRSLKNQRRAKVSFLEGLSSLNRRAQERANRRGGKRGEKFVWAAFAASDVGVGAESVEWQRRIFRWSLALLLLPFCWVTSWTFLSRFSQATVHQDFWKTAEFYYFATGALVMVGWLWSGLLKTFFLYLYVLGHELTHAIFVVLFRGKVTDFYVSADGGYITTNKTNWVIALSPYFVPFWAVVVAVVYALLRYCADLPQHWDRVLYGLMGVTWTFHMAWTLWMIPRDQPDLKENGTFLSLVVIYLANLLVLVALLCLAADSPLKNAQDFAQEWFRHAATWGDGFFRWVTTLIENIRVRGKF